MNERQAERSRKEAGDEAVEFTQSRLVLPSSNTNNIEEDNDESSEEASDAVINTEGAATTQECDNLIVTPCSIRPDPKSVDKCRTNLQVVPKLL